MCLTLWPQYLLFTHVDLHVYVDPPLISILPCWCADLLDGILDDEIAACMPSADDDDLPEDDEQSGNDVFQQVLNVLSDPRYTPTLSWANSSLYDRALCPYLELVKDKTPAEVKLLLRGGIKTFRLWATEGASPPFAGICSLRDSLTACYAIRLPAQGGHGRLCWPCHMRH